MASDPIIKEGTLRPRYRCLSSTTGEGKPFLTILTRRHPDRPILSSKHWKANEAQLEAIDFPIQQIEIYGARNVAEANQLLGHPDLHGMIDGEYVMVLDDDDRFAHSMAVQMIQAYVRVLKIARAKTSDHRDIDWIMIRGSVSDRPDGPFPVPWGPSWRPRRGNIPSFCMVVSAALWVKASRGWRTPRAGDAAFAQLMWDLGHRPVWMPTKRPLVETMRVSKGRGD